MNAPFKFLDAYKKEDFAVFFGREKETEALYDSLSGVKHLLVYGPSGSGKTSLVECGLRNQFSDADCFALTIRKGENINASVFARINEILKEKIPVDEKTAFSDAVERLFAEKYQPVYLLFDQFEELLIQGEQAEKNEFFTRIQQLVRYKVPCRIIFIMREEFIGHLSEFESLFPTIFQHRFRLEKMNRSHVQHVIQSILEAPEYQSFFKVDDSEALAQKMLSKLPDERKEIELAHVQVFLSEIWDKATKDCPANEIPLLHQGLIGEDDKLEGVLQSFLKKQLDEFEPVFGKNTALEVLATMVSERHTKLQLSQDAIAQDLQNKSVSLAPNRLAALLEAFEKRRILRTLKADNYTQYELSHDILALIVGQNLTEEMKMREKATEIYKVYQGRSGFFSQEDLDYIRPYLPYKKYPTDLQQRITESEENIRKTQEVELAKAKAIAEKEAKLREEAEAQKKVAKKRSWIAVGVAGIAIVAFGIALWQYNEAIVNADKAKKAQISDSIATAKAIRSEDSLKIQRDTAIISQKRAIEMKAIADKEATKAKLSYDSLVVAKEDILTITKAKEAEKKAKEDEIQKKNEISFKESMQRGANLVLEGKYDDAIVAYNMALSYTKNPLDVLKMIQSVKELKQIHLDYDKLITEANTILSNPNINIIDYEMGYSRYQEAIKTGYKDKGVAKREMEKIGDILVKKYEDNGDIFCRAGGEIGMEKAAYYYKKALELRPDITRLKTKLIQCQN